MKKTLVALAAIAATSAFADVSITGFIDQAYNRAASTTSAGVRTSSSNVGANAIGQDQITFSTSEDLGDGLTAFGSISIHPSVSGASLGGDVGNIGIKGAFGSVKFASDYGTGWYVNNSADASGWGSGAGQVHNVGAGLYNGMVGAGGAYATAATNASTGLVIYTLPTIVQGLGVTVATRAGGDATGKNLGNANAYMVTYGIGGLALAMSGTTLTNPGTGVNWSSDKIGGAQVVNDTLTAGTKSTAKNLSATYDLGVAKLYYGNASAKSGDDADQKATSSTYGVSVPFGAFSLGVASSTASYTAANTTTSKETGLRILGKYALSKRTSVYVQNGTTKVSGSTAAETTTGLGLTHSF